MLYTPVISNLRIFGRVEQSGTRKVSGNVEFPDTPNNPRQFQDLTQVQTMEGCNLLQPHLLLHTTFSIIHILKMSHSMGCGGLINVL